MNRFLTLLLLFPVVVCAQTAQFTGFVTQGTALQPGAAVTATPLYAGLLITKTGAGEQLPDVNEASMSLWREQAGEYPGITVGQTGMIGLADQTPAKDSVLMAMLANYKPVKSGFNEIINLPNGKDGRFELREEAQTASGVTARLSTTVLSAAYFSQMPATEANGAGITLKATYQEKLIGSGIEAWLTATAPQENQPAAITLTTYANLFPKNNNGTIAINVADGNSFQFATTGQGGLIGWRSTAGTNITFAADNITMDGRLTVAGAINTPALDIANQQAALNISPSGLVLGDGMSSAFIGTGSGLGYNGDSYMSLFIQSRNSGGITIAADNEQFADLGYIRFSVNRLEVGRFTEDGFQLRTLHDDEIRRIRNPKLGLQVYSIDRLAPATYNGKQWTYSACDQTL